MVNSLWRLGITSTGAVVMVVFKSSKALSVVSFQEYAFFLNWRCQRLADYSIIPYESSTVSCEAQETS